MLAGVIPALAATRDLLARLVAPHAHVHVAEKIAPQTRQAVMPVAAPPMARAMLAGLTWSTTRLRRALRVALAKDLTLALLSALPARLARTPRLPFTTALRVLLASLIRTSTRLRRARRVVLAPSLWKALSHAMCAASARTALLV